MSDLEKTASTVAKVFRAIADRLERDPTFVEEFLRPTHHGATKPSVPSRSEVPQSDIFDLWSREGEERVRAHLGSLDMATLKEIISRHGFDRNGLARKWKTSSKLIGLIIERLASRSERGAAFKEYGSATPES